MKIWLDDERDPSDEFIQGEYNADKDMVWVKTAEEAIQLLKTGKITYISLDHDLGQEKTGYDVAKWIEKKAFDNMLLPLEWHIHTDNMVGYKNIMTAMMNADRFWHSYYSDREVPDRNVIQ